MDDVTKNGTPLKEDHFLPVKDSLNWFLNNFLNNIMDHVSSELG